MWPSTPSTRAPMADHCPGTVFPAPATCSPVAATWPRHGPSAGTSRTGQPQPWVGHHHWRRETERLRHGRMANGGVALWWWNRAIGGREMEREGRGCCEQGESKSEGPCCSNLAGTRARLWRSVRRQWRPSLAFIGEQQRGRGGAWSGAS